MQKIKALINDPRTAICENCMIAFYLSSDSTATLSLTERMMTTSENQKINLARLTEVEVSYLVSRVFLGSGL